MISFNAIPNNILIPGYYAEFDSSNAGTVDTTALRILVIGQALSGPMLEPQQIFSSAGASIFGFGSILDAGVSALKAANRSTECWAIGLADPDDAVSASATISFIGPASAGGTIALYIGGTRLALPVAAGDTAAVLASKAAEQINNNRLSLVSAAAAAGVVTLTANNAGVVGNDIPLLHSFEDDESLPSGVGIAITPMTGGAGEIDLSAVWAAIGDEQYNIIILPGATSALLNNADTEMLRRAGPAEAIDGLAVAGFDATVSEAITFGKTRNNQFVSLLATHGSPEHPFVSACAYYGAAAAAAEIDPSRPFQTLRVSGLYAPRRETRFTNVERSALLGAGISTFTVDASGAMIIERPITTYQTNPLGENDTAWLDINVPLALANIRRTFRSRYALRYPRHKLADDGAIFAPGQAAVTPRMLRAENAAIYNDLALAGQVDDVEGFVAEQIVERDANDRSRVNQLLPIRLIGQLRVQAALIQYQL